MGFIPEQQIEELKSRIDIVDIISEYVDLKRAGSSFKGLCPFHNEKTPSFMVNRERNNFHCFGCHEGGDAISFIMKMENLEYIDAVKFIAEKLGISLEETEYSKEKISRNNKLYEINSKAARFYFKELLTNQLPQKYLMERQLSKNILNKYFLGYANHNNDLYKYLKKEGFEEQDMLDLGLIGEKNGSYYDKFRDRLIFPILNNKNKVIGFGGRTLNNNNIKYLNSPESDIFIKGKNVYGVNVIKRNKQDKIILVEGYMDVISLYNHGIDYALASLGTALTEDQAKIILRYSKEVYIAYDGDTAGIKATLRAIEIFKNLDVQLKILEFPNGMDPDEFIKLKGREAFEKMLNKASNVIDYKLKKLYESSQNQIDFIKGITEFLASIKGNVVRDLYIDKSAKFIGVTTDSLRNDVEIIIKKNSERDAFRNTNHFDNNKIGYKSYTSNVIKNVEKPVNNENTKKSLLQREILLYSLINEFSFNLLREFKDFLDNEDYSKIYKKIEKYYNDNLIIEDVLNMDSFINLGLNKEYDKLIKNEDVKLNSILEELKHRIEVFKLQTRLGEIKEELREKRGDKELLLEYTNLLQKLT
ncbi:MULTISPECIES: DNA primase [Helcococcus]|uniref:DNA primase n=1 Tax=Helcococcus bovis TaxID=3153252 RepID=A0ABW9F857_9FIRM